MRRNPKRWGGWGNKGCHVTAISSCHSTDSQNGSVSQQLGEGPRIYDRCTTPQKELWDFEVWCSLGASKLELRNKCYFYDPCGTGCGKNLLAETFLVAHPEPSTNGGDEATRVAMWQPFRAATAQTAKMARFHNNWARAQGSTIDALRRKRSFETLRCGAA